MFLCIGIEYWIGLHSYALIKNHGISPARYPLIGILYWIGSYLIDRPKKLFSGYGVSIQGFGVSMYLNRDWIGLLCMRY